MKDCIKAAAALLLVAMLSAGQTFAKAVQLEYNDGKVDWLYETIDPGKTCRLWAAHAPQLKGAIAIPAEVVEANGNKLRVVEIGENSFFRGLEITSIQIPNSVTAIGKAVFQDCGKLTEITLPESIDSISHKAFYGCTALPRMVIPKGVRKIMGGIFVGCKKLREVVVAKGNTHYRVDDGVLMSFDRTTLVYYPMWKDLKEYNIPSSVQTLAIEAFNGCENLEKISIPAGIQSIPAGAFYGCNKLQSVTLPRSVTHIGENAFSYCRALTRIALPKRLTEIGIGAFSSCDALASIRIPHTVESVGDFAFYGCPQLKEVYWLASTSCKVYINAFRVYKSVATLYVKRGLEATFSQQEWVDGVFKVEGLPGVDFVDTDNTLLDAQLVKAGEKAEEPEPPVKAGHTFKRWTLDGKPYDFKTPVTDNLTIMAQWESHTVTVSFDPDGGTPTPEKQELKYNEQAKEPKPAPSKPGFTFKGWYLDGKAYDFREHVTKDITLKAKWEKETAVESPLLAGVTAASNPFGAELTLLGAEQAERVTVYSLAGVLMYTSPLHGENVVTLPTDRWNPGVYVARFSARDGEKVLLVVKR